MRSSYRSLRLHALLPCAALLLAGAFARSAAAQGGVPGTPGSGSAARLYMGGADRSRTASNRTIIGHVTDVNGKPVESAMVYLKNTRTSGVQVLLTGADGAYRFSPMSLSEDYQIWAQVGERKTAPRTVSQFNPVPTVSMPLRFEPATPPAAPAKPVGAPSAAVSPAPAQPH